MSKAKHLQAILRSQQFLLQLHNPIAVGVSPTAGSLRLLSSRLAHGPGLDSSSSPFHTSALSQPVQQQQQEPQHRSHHRSGQRQQASRVRRRDLLCGSRTVAPACLYTSVRAYSFAPSRSASATVAAASSSSANASTTSNSPASAAAADNHASESISASSTGGSQSVHVFTGQTPAGASAARWISELPWIDPDTGASYEPGKAPPRSGSGGGAGAGAGTGASTSKSSSFFTQPVHKTRHNYVFAFGASGFPKNPGKAPTLTPEQDRAYSSVQVGEDAYFSRHDALGVADGVGGWCGTTGANPALYSRKLMHYAFMELEKYDDIEEEAFYDYFNVNPVDILEKSYEHSLTDAKNEGLIGSSTACLAILRDDELRIANLGDCGVSVIRRNEFIFRTEEQQHSFNYPYQLGTGSSDSPSDALTFTVKVESGDIVVMGSDGIFDNLFDEDILEEVVQCVGGEDPNQNQNQDPYGTGSPTRAGKGVSGLWSELTSSASSTIAAIAGKATTTAATADTATTPAPEGTEPVTTFFNTSDDPESPCELSPLAAAAIAAAHSSAMPPSAALYSISTASQKRQYERRIPEPRIICDALAKRAKNVSEDTRHHGSPFQSRAMQEGLYYQGGKRDDMSVLVAIIKVAEDSPDRR